jgi:CHAT domain-containing protein
LNDVLLKPSAACPVFRDARRLLESGGSPYSALARERIVVTCLYPAESQAAFAELARLQEMAQRRAFVQILGRVHWMEALFRGHQGELSASFDGYRLALERFQALRDADGEASVLARLAEALVRVGEGRSAWRERMRGLALLDQVRGDTRRQSILGGTAFACVDARLLRSALQLEMAALDAWRQQPQAVPVALTYVRRSQVYHALGSPERASADVAEARRWLARIDDGVWGPLTAAYVDGQEGRILATASPERAVASIERALAYFSKTNPLIVPELRLQLARALRARGTPDAAERELEAAIQLLESQRVSVKGTGLRESFFENAAALFDEMVTLQVDVRHDPRRALAFVERGRARQLLESLGPTAMAGSTGSGAAVSARLAPLGPDAVQRELPEGLALVYYECFPSRLLSWVVTRNGVQFSEQALPLEDLQHTIAAYETALVRRAPVSVIREHAGRLFDTLARPATEAVPAGATLAFVLDESLQSLPFAALWDGRRGRYLAEDHVVGVVPSGTVFVKASAAANARGRAGTQRLLAVGNPRVDRARSNPLPALPAAETEALEVASLYEDSNVLTGTAATKAAFLDGLGRSQVVHFAGHAVVGDTPGTARLLLAPDPRTETSGELRLHEIDRFLPRTRVVVLAACRTAAGTPSRLEGGFALATPFLAAGVPNVVASLWNLDDEVSRRFFVAFHESLIGEGEPTGALQRTQMSFLHDADPVLAHPAAWAGLVSLGGVALSR